MVLFIRIYPILAACMAYILLEFARNMRRKGKKWIMIAFVALLFLASIGLWVYYRGDRNAEQWAKELASLNFFAYTHFV